MPKLKEIKTFVGLIEKIETLVTKLKIAANFNEVNNTFPLKVCGDKKIYTY